MQGRIQKWVDHSISVTINLPSDATEELVGKLYIEAWKSGCKGVTVYRDGSRSGVLISNSGSEKKKSGFPTKRPEKLDADVVRFQNNKEKWIAFMGLLNGKPYEIFTGLSDDEDGILLPRSITRGYIIKNYDPDGNSRYDFQYITKEVIKLPSKDCLSNSIRYSGIMQNLSPEHYAMACLFTRWWNWLQASSSTMKQLTRGKLVWPGHLRNIFLTVHSPKMHCARNVAPMKWYIRKDASPVYHAGPQNADSHILDE